jgi:Ca2+-transporting ATPase
MIDISKIADTPWHTISSEEAASILGTDLTKGLDSNEAKLRLSQFGCNSLVEEKKESFWKEFLEKLREPLVLMLLITGVLYAIWGELADAIIIFVIILTLNTVEVINEQRSKKAIRSLRKLSEPTMSVIREGQFLDIPVDQAVPGDLIYLQEGHRVPADARLIEACSLSVDESSLTGESLPVEKRSDAISNHNLPLAECHNMVYSSTLVSRGKGKALIISTGMNTEIGRIAGMTHRGKEPRTPLQETMEELSRTLVWVALGFSVLIPLIGIFLTRLPPKQMLLTGLSLAFATIPEELPIIITMVLSLGAFRLSKKHAVVKRLHCVETLGSVTIIATDKTGTLTQNRIEVAQFEPEAAKNHLLEIGVFCNDAIPDSVDFSGDAVDSALLRAAKRSGLEVNNLRIAQPILHEFPFDNDRKRMSTVSMRDGKFWSAVKGSPESILSQCKQRQIENTMEKLTNQTREIIMDKVAKLAADGLRVLAFAERTMPDEHFTQDLAENDLTFVGLIGLQDPPRAEARDAIATCQKAGVRVVMITGDHPLTAKSIGQQIGLNGSQELVTGPEVDHLSSDELKKVVQHTSIFARTTPEHKLRIVQALQSSGERVAVTGDGVNDAPALSAADIGIAMGEIGTDVAREASDMVLLDDSLTTIVSAVKEGRLIYENLKKGVRYYLTCKLALVLINLLPALLLVPVPFAPVQIILMEFFMDLMAAASFVTEKPESDLLEQKPRDLKTKFMNRSMAGNIVTSSIGLFASVTIVYLFTWFSTANIATSQTVAFFSWLIGHVLLAFNMRSDRQPIYQLGLGSNRMMVIWGAGIAIFLLGISLIPGAQSLVKTTSLTVSQWEMIIITTFIGTFWLEIKKGLTFKRKNLKVTKK